MPARTCLALLALLLTAACGSGASLTYDANPAIEVIYADVVYNGGAPSEGQTCLYPSVPVLRVWGDGLAFVRVTGSADEVHIGTLSSEQLSGLLSFLNDAGYFGDWTPEVPNPAANYLYVGLNLANDARRLTFSTFDPAFYVELVDQLVPLLTRREPDDPVDSRIFDLNDTRECLTPPPPIVTPPAP